MASKSVDRKMATSITPQKASYRDDPDAVSMHTTRSDYEYDDAPELPSYSDSVPEVNQSPTVPRGAAPHDEYAVITPSASLNGSWFGKPSVASAGIGCETTYRMDERLNDPQALSQYISSYLANVPPNPFVRVQGWHNEMRKKDNKKQKERICDFDIKMSLRNFLDNVPETSTSENSDSVHRGSFRKTRAPGYKQDIEVGMEQNPDLIAWCRDFCDSKSTLKVFRISRQTIGWNEDWLKELITNNVIRKTSYRGHVDISFPVADKNVDIFTPHWVNRARVSWVRWLFYLTFLWLITWPILFFLTKRWSVYCVKWCYSRVDQQRVKRYAVLAEDEWVTKHANLLSKCALDRYQGDATDLPMPTAADVEAAVRRASGAAPQTGNRNVDAALSFVHGGMTAWNTLNGRDQQGGWGADSC